MPPRLGKATEFFRQRNIGQSTGAKAVGSAFDFSRLSELEYRTILKDGGYSESYIDHEMEQLRRYRNALETSGVSGARRKLARKQEAEADPTLAQYIQAAERRKDRLKERGITNEETEERGDEANLGGYSGRSRR